MGGKSVEQAPRVLNYIFIEFSELTKFQLNMVEFSDLFDDENDVFQKKAKVCIARQMIAFVSRTPPLNYYTLVTKYNDLSVEGESVRYNRLGWHIVFSQNDDRKRNVTSFRIRIERRGGAQRDNLDSKLMT